MNENTTKNTGNVEAILKAIPATDKDKATPATPDVTKTITHNDIAVIIKRTETERVKAGKEAIAYWTVELAQFEDKATKDKDGKDIPAEPLVVWTTCDTLIGHDMMLSKLQSKLNQDLRASQMEEGKDVYTMDEKFTHLEAYIKGGFGSERTGGVTGAMYAALKTLDTQKSQILARLAQVATALFSPATPKDQLAKLQAELVELTGKAAALQS